MFTYFLFIIRSSVEDFRRNKVRTLLTSLGILIGVSSVVLLMAFGLGLKKYIQGQFESLGTNLVIILPGKILQGGGFRSGGGAFGGAQFDERDALQLQKVKQASYVVPVFIKSLNVSFGGNTEVSDMYATTPDIFPLRNLEVETGRLFDKNDLEKRGKVAVVGPKIAEKLYGGTDLGVGKILKTETQSFTIVGILKSKGGGGFGGPDFDSFMYVPYKSAYSFNPNKTFITFYLKAESDTAVVSVKENIKTILLKRYKEDDFSVIEQTEILNAVSSIFNVMNLVLVAIAAISLIVGGIGIMNIMYVSVVERIREIGIRRAIGATRKDILLQFLAEAIILSLLGGLLGLILSEIIVMVIQRFFPAYIDLRSIGIALGVSSVIGIVFGVIPARKAANLSPMDAIRYE